MKDVTSHRVSSLCTDLDAATASRVEEFMLAAIRAFELKDAGLLESLCHDGGDPRSGQSSREFNQFLMDGGDNIVSWVARPYTEPQWSIMRIVRHAPRPTVWIDVVLNDGKREYDYYFALAPSDDGRLLSCYYTDRDRPSKLAR